MSFFRWFIHSLSHTRSEFAHVAPKTVLAKKPLDAAVLEDRVMFSATPLANLAPAGELNSASEASFDNPFTSPVEQTTLLSSSDKLESGWGDGARSFEEQASIADAQAARREVVFIDAAADDYQQLVDDLVSQQDDERFFEIVLLDPERDGIDQISETLAGFDEVSAIHIVSHGDDGRVKIGSSWLSSDNLDAYAGQIAGWQDALTAEGDLLFYNCNLAASQVGRLLVESVGALCDCDVAASTDDTGHAELGGDWDLEYSVGRVETPIAFRGGAEKHWRGLLNATPDGGEFLVNTTTSNTQTFSSEIRRSVAHDANGNFVVVWQAWNQDGDSYGVFGRRFDADGTPQGSEFQVNTETTNNQRRPAVAMNAAGSFVVVWDSDLQDGSGIGVYAQRFDAAGSPIGGEFQVNTETNNNQVYASAAIDEAGNFVVTWSSMDQDGNSMGVFAQRYDFAGNPVGGEFQVNTTTFGAQQKSAVAMNTGGNFVIAWTDSNQDGSGNGVVARRYDSSGAAQGGEFQVNTFATDSQSDPSVAMDSAGNFVVAWTSATQDSDGSSGIYAQRYDAGGVRLGGEFRVNDVIAGDQSYASIALRDNGYFAIAFQSSDGQDGDQNGIYVKEYNAAGEVQSAGVLVNTTTSGNQRYPSITMDDDQDFVVLWSGNGVGDTSGVFARRFETNLAAVAVNDSYNMDQDMVLNVASAGGVLTNDTDEDGDLLTAVLVTDVSNGALTLNADGSFDYTPNPGYVGTDVFEYAANDGGANSNTAKVLIHVNQTAVVTAGSEVRVNTTTASTQATLTDTPQNVAANGDGDSVVVWASNLQDDGSSWGIYAQLYDDQGNPVGGEILVNTTTAGDQLNPAVAMDESGDFVVVWESDDSDGAGVYAQIFQEDGGKYGSQFRVNQTTAGNQLNPTVAMDLFGNFVVGWESDDGDSSGIYARLFESDGDPDSGEFLVNTTTTGVQRGPSAAMDRTRDFVIAWESDHSGDWDVYAQRFNEFAAPQGGQTLVNATTANDQRFASVAMDDAGNYVVTWSSFGQDGDGMGVYARQFDFGGAAQGSEFQVNTETTDDQAFSTVSMSGDGDFVISWSSLNQDGGLWGVYAQEYDSTGNTRGTELQVNATTGGSQSISSVALDDDRDFIVVWSGNGSGDSAGVFAQRYETNLKPTGYDDTYGVDQGASLTIAAPGVLSNDAEPDSDPMAATLVTDVSNGTLGLNPDGSFTYTPDAGYLGTDSFTYFANDGAFETEVMTVKLIVGPGPGPTGSEFRVNSFTGDTQQYSDVAVAANGDFVVVWDSLNQDGGSWGVYGQRYKADGTPQGAEFRINQTTSDRQRYVDVDMDLLGNFVVTWTSEGQDGDSSNESNVYMRRYNAAGAPLSGEILVNQTTNMDQSISTVAIDDATGNYLITWTNESAASWDIMGRRYDAAGNPLSGEFQINTSALDFGFVSNAAVDISGNFVVTWTGADEDGWGIFARRFAWNETPFGAEYQVNSSAFGTQFISYIGMDATTGDHVITWSSFGQDNDSPFEGNVYAQRYDGSGNPLGGEFLVNSHTDGSQWVGGVSMAPGGDFVITWESDGQDGSGDGVYAQRYAADGMPEGAEFHVNSTTGNDQSGPAVAMDALGNFVITWDGNGPGDGAGVFGQSYEVVPVADEESYNVDEDSSLIVGAASGVLVGDTDPNGDPLTAVLIRDVQNGALALNPDGSFSYAPDPEFDGQDTFVYVANDGANDSNYTVVTINVGQVNDAPVLENSGAMSLSMNEDETDPAGTTVAAIIASAGGDRITDVDTGAEEGIAVTGLTNPNGTWEYSLDGGSIWNTFGAPADNSATLLDAAALVRFIPDPDFQGTGGTLSFRAWDHTSGSNGQTGVDVSVNGGQTAFSSATETASVTVNPINDAPVNGVPGVQATPQDTPLQFNAANGNLVSVSDVDAASGQVEVMLTATSGTVTLGWPSGTAAVDGGEFRINATTSDDQVTLDGGFYGAADEFGGPRAVASDPSGNFVVTWSSKDQDGDKWGIYAQRYDAAGVAQGGEFLVNTTTTKDQVHSSVAMDDAGNFTIVWASEDQDGDKWGIYAQRYDAAGSAQGGEFLVNTITTKEQLGPSIAMDGSGDFVVSWSSKDQDGDNWGVYAKRFNAAGVAQGGEFRVNHVTTKEQTASRVAIDADGDFVVTWSSEDQDSDKWGVYAKRFNAAGVPQGSEFLVNSTTSKEQEFSSVAMDADGNFVITWSSKDQDGDNWGVYARRYDWAGVAQGGEFRVNVNTTKEQMHSSVAMDADGDFVITWSSKDQDGDKFGVYSRQYTASGIAKGGETLVNTTTAGEQEYSSVAMDAQGDFIVVWSGNGPGDDPGVFGQRFTVPTGLTFITGDGTRDATMTFRGTLAEVNTVLDGLMFTPNTGFNGLATITMTTDDLGNTGSGSAQSDADIININVGTGNVAPTVTLSGGALNYTENDPATPIDASATVTDPDSSDFDGAELTVSFIGNGAGNDRLAIRNEGTALGQIGVSGGNVTYNFGAGAVVIGSFSGGADDVTPLIVTLNSNATATAAAALTRNVTYENVADDPSTLTRIVQFLLTDGDGGTNNPVSRNINVIAVNDIPTLSSFAGVVETTNEDIEVEVTLAELAAQGDEADIDGAVDAFVVKSVASGTLKIGATTGTATAWASGTNDTIDATNNAYWTPDLNVNGTRNAFDVVAKDNQSAESVGNVTAQMDVAAVNDAPSWTGNGTLANIAEDNANPPGDTITNLMGGQYNDIDPDAFDGVAVIGNTANPVTEGAWQYSTDGGTNWFDVAAVGDGATALALSTGTLLRFVPVTDFNGSPPDLIMRALDATYGSGYTDGAARSNVDTTTKGGVTAISGNTANVSTTVDSVNDPPVLANVAGDTLLYAEGSGALVIEQGGDALVNDVDSTDFAGGQLRVSIAAGGIVTEDVLSIRNQGVNPGEIGFVLGNVTYGGVTIGSAAGGVLGTDLVINLTGAATPAAVAALINNITYENFDLLDATAGIRTTRFALDDGDGNISLPHDAFVNVNSTNTPPNATNMTQVRPYTEGAASVALDDIVVTDPDSGDTIAAILTLADTSTGSLTTGVFGAVTSTYNPATGQWQAIGNVTDVNAALADVAFLPNLNNDLDTTILTHIEDAAAAGPGDGVLTLDVSPVNDQPLFSGLDNTPAFTEGGPAVVLDNDATIADVELDAANDYSGATLTLVRNGGANADDLFDGGGALNPLVESGNLVVGAAAIGTVTTNSGGVLVLTFNSNATTALVNSALQQITYANASVNPPAGVQIAFTMDDGNAGGQGSGGALSDTGSITVAISPANSAPTLDLDLNNNSGAGGNDYTFVFTEGDAPTPIADSDTDLADVDSASFDHVTLTISGLLNGNAEELWLDGDTFALATAVAGQNTIGGAYHVVITTGIGTADVTISKQGGGTFNEVETETLAPNDF